MNMWKHVMKRVINACKVTRDDHMRILAAEANAIVNDGSRKGGFSPAQWVLGRSPRAAETKVLVGEQRRRRRARAGRRDERKRGRL